MVGSDSGQITDPEAMLFVKHRLGPGLTQSRPLGDFGLEGLLKVFGRVRTHLTSTAEDLPPVSTLRRVDVHELNANPACGAMPDDGTHL